MIVCPKCGKEHIDGTKFCSSCGFPMEAAGTCPECGKPVKEGSRFCASCGGMIEGKILPLPFQANAEAVKDELNGESSASEAASGDSSVKEAVSGESSASEAALGDSSVKEAASGEAADRKSGKDHGSMKYFVLGVIGFAALVGLSYLINMIGTGDSGRHYAMYLKDSEIMYSNLMKSGEWQVSSDLSRDDDITQLELMRTEELYSGRMSKDGSLLFFPDKLEYGQEGISLYYRSALQPQKEPQKVDSFVAEYYVSDDGKRVTYTKTPGDLYQYNLSKGEKEKIAKEVRSYKVSDDGSKVVYLKDSGELCLWNKKSSDRLDNDIQRLCYISSDVGTFYYVKDGALYKKVGRKDKEKIAADVRQVLRIYDNGEAYYTKNDSGSEVLWYFDGKETERLAEKFGYYYASDESDADRALMVYSAWDSDEPGKLRLYIALGKDLTELEYEDARKFTVDPKGKYLYFLSDLSNADQSGDLYRINVSKGRLSYPERYDSDVSAHELYLTETDQILYFKEYAQDKGELYCNKKKLDSDVSGTGFSYMRGTQEVVYFVDFIDSPEYSVIQKGTGTLKKAGLKSGRTRKVADDIGQYAATPAGNILYLYDYNLKTMRGDLYLYKGKKAIKLDDDVAVILKVQ